MEVTRTGSLTQGGVKSQLSYASADGSASLTLLVDSVSVIGAPESFDLTLPTEFVFTELNDTGGLVTDPAPEPAAEPNSDAGVTSGPSASAVDAVVPPVEAPSADVTPLPDDKVVDVTPKTNQELGDELTADEAEMHSDEARIASLEQTVANANSPKVDPVTGVLSLGGPTTVVDSTTSPSVSPSASVPNPNDAAPVNSGAPVGNVTPPLTTLPDSTTPPDSGPPATDPIPTSTGDTSGTNPDNSSSSVSDSGTTSVDSSGPAAVATDASKSTGSATTDSSWSADTSPVGSTADAALADPSLVPPSTSSLDQASGDAAK